VPLRLSRAVHRTLCDQVGCHCQARWQRIADEKKRNNADAPTATATELWAFDPIPSRLLIVSMRPSARLCEASRFDSTALPSVKRGADANANGEAMSGSEPLNAHSSVEMNAVI
jgi:hypothetical protein